MAKSSINQSIKTYSNEFIFYFPHNPFTRNLFKKIILLCFAFSGNAVAESVSNGYFTSADITGFSNYSMVLNERKSGNNLTVDLEKEYFAMDGNMGGRSAADLTTGTLKSYFYSQSSSTSGKLTGGDTRTSFGDSFVHSNSNGSAYDWSPVTNGHFVFSISGYHELYINSEPSSLADAGYAGGLVFLTFLRPESLGSCFPVSSSNCEVLESYAWGLSSANNEFLNTKTKRFEPVTGFVSDGSLVNLELPFQGDFSWVLTLTAGAYSDDLNLPSGKYISAVSDYSHTLNAHYFAPQGAVVNSASNAFPIFSAPVPLPASFSLLGLGLASLLGVARRRI